MNSIVVIRDFTIRLVNSIISLLRILVMSKWFLAKSEKSKDSELVILGNGPSLKSFLKNSSPFLNEKAVAAVNYFARTEEYEQIKPDYYFICSPEYFLKEEKQDWASDREETMKAIADRTTWKMELVVPGLARKQKKWKQKIERNENISIRYLNTTPVEGFTWLEHFCFSNNLGMPRPHNVLIPAILEGIKLGFKKVYLTGSDHSWLNEINVDENNEVLLRQKHFYDKQTENQANDKNKPTPKPMYHGTSLKKRKLHEVLEKFYTSFKSYWTLRGFATKRKVEVVNLTLDSFIDAFDKIDPNEKRST